MRVRLIFFGTPLIVADDAPVRFENRKAAALLAYLSALPQAHSREKLAALLWPDTDQALAALRTTLWEIRKKIGADWLNITRQDITLTPDDDCWADVAAYSDLLRRAAASDLDRPTRITLLQQAVDLVQDDFLAGFSLRDSAEFDDWQRDQQRYYQRLQGRALADLAALYEQAGDLNAAIFTAERLRTLDRLAEAPVEILIRLHAAVGQRQQALRAYHDYAALLDAELGAAPSEAVRALVDSLVKSTARSTQPARMLSPAGEGLAIGGVTAAIFREPDAVPGRPRRLIGRDALLRRLLPLLQEGERVLLTGMGGIGKTSTAAAAAAAFIAATGAPVLWLETAFQSADEIFVALARCFDRQQAALTQRDPGALVRDLLATQRSLLVLDNCWNAGALFDVLRILPAALPVLLTSRLRIPIDGEVIDLTVLNPDDARTLIAHHARRDLPDDADFAALLRMMGGHPYALEIAGKQLKAQPGLTVRDLRARYARGTQEIAVPGGFGEEGRENIARVIAASVEALSADARITLTQMGALPTPRASAEMVALMLDAAPEALDAALGELEQASLIGVEGGGSAIPLYRLHDLTHGYCRDQVRGADDARRRLIAGVTAYVRRHSRQPLHIEAEYGNILGAVRAARQAGDGAMVIEIVRAIMIDGYFDARGYTSDLLDHLDTAVTLAEDVGVDAHEALHLLLSKRINVMQMQGRLDEAFSDNLRALATAPDMYRRALLATTLATIAYRLKQSEYTLYLNEAEAVARRHAFHDILCRITEFRGVVASTDGDREGARLHLTDAVEHAEKMNDPRRLFFALYNLAVVEIELMNCAAAEDHLRAAHALAEAQGSELWMAMCFSGMGRCTHLRGDHEQTYRLMTDALTAYQRIGDRRLAEWVQQFLRDEGYVRAQQ
ncbi:MAG: hypothetical protein JNL42_13960 [Anaerolineae bacterium]|nr:hypothetical protein [Anaerolineae bacterium]